MRYRETCRPCSPFGDGAKAPPNRAANSVQTNPRRNRGFVYVEAVSFRVYSGVLDSQSPVGSHRQPQHLLVKFAYMFGLADMHGENICDVGTDADTARSGFMLHNRPYRAG
jgi:hypothetical protein